MTIAIYENFITISAATKLHHLHHHTRELFSSARSDLAQAQETTVTTMTTTTGSAVLKLSKEKSQHELSPLPSRKTLIENRFVSVLNKSQRTEQNRSVITTNTTTTTTTLATLTSTDTTYHFIQLQVVNH
ncbi:hypothetical protein TYRP_022121 [Tyrophagus putrescentiae]|nr:hypothetical protein TYRP_022121 [Tyrophagus putrescentiae]